MGHKWSNDWPGNFCRRCGAEQVLEIALAENWFAFAEPGSPEVWKSEKHKELVTLCDDTCYADLTPEERGKHGDKIRALEREIGLTGVLRISDESEQDN